MLFTFNSLNNSQKLTNNKDFKRTIISKKVATIPIEKAVPPTKKIHNISAQKTVKGPLAQSLPPKRNKPSVTTVNKPKPIISERKKNTEALIKQNSNLPRLGRQRPSLPDSALNPKKRKANDNAGNDIKRVKLSNNGTVSVGAKSLGLHEINMNKPKTTNNKMMIEKKPIEISMN